MRLPRPTLFPAHVTRTPVRSSIATLLALVLSLAVVGLEGPSPASADVAQEIKNGQAQLDKLNVASEMAAERYNAGRIKLATAQHVATAAQAAVARDTAALTKLRSQVGAFAAGLYRRGPGGQGLSLLSTGNPSTYLQQIGTLDQISKSQAHVMADLATARSRQASASASAKAALGDAEATLRGLQKDKAQVEVAAGQAQRVLSLLQVKQQQLIQAAKDAAARQAAQARATELATEARNAAAAAAAFQVSPNIEPPQGARRHYSGNAAQIAVQVAKEQLGKSYVYGAAGPDHFDCSGLTMYAYAQAGISLPHYTGAQYQQGRHVTQSELQPGDLVFFEKNLGHVGMYLGNGRFIHAPHTGDVVKVSSLTGYYQEQYAGAVRVAG